MKVMGRTALADIAGDSHGRLPRAQPNGLFTLNNPVRHCKSVGCMRTPRPRHRARLPVASMLPVAWLDREPCGMGRIGTEDTLIASPSSIARLPLQPHIDLGLRLCLRAATRARPKAVAA